MGLGPIEVVVIAFPGNEFNGDILPELERLIENDIIALVDGVLVMKTGDDDVEFIEFGQIDADSDAAKLAELLDQVEDLISDDDVAELAAGLAPDSSAAILVFEHTWAKPFRDAVVGSGGYLAANFRVPGIVVDEVLANLEAS